MAAIKKVLGFVWLVMGLIMVIYLPYLAVVEIAKGQAEDIVFWTIMVIIFIPISLGFSLFGWYALKGEYRDA